MEYELKYGGPTWDLTVNELVAVSGIFIGPGSVREGIAEKLGRLLLSEPKQGVFVFYEWFSAQEGFDVVGVDEDLIGKVIELHSQRLYLYRMAEPAILGKFDELQQLTSEWCEQQGSPRIPTFRNGRYWFWFSRQKRGSKERPYCELMIHRRVYLRGKDVPDAIVRAAKEFGELACLSFDYQQEHETVR